MKSVFNIDKKQLSEFLSGSLINDQVVSVIAQSDELMEAFRSSVGIYMYISPEHFETALDGFKSYERYALIEASFHLCIELTKMSGAPEVLVHSEHGVYKRFDSPYGMLDVFPSGLVLRGEHIIGTASLVLYLFDEPVDGYLEPINQIKAA